MQRPAAANSCLVLAHGAGAGMGHPFMAALAHDLAAIGIATLRFQFLYMEARGKRPDPPALCHATRGCCSSTRTRSLTAFARRRQVVWRPHDLASAGGNTASSRTRLSLLW